MLNSTASASAASEFFTALGYAAHDAAVFAFDAATGEEAIALYVRTGKALAHGLAFLITLAVWGLVELVQLSRSTVRREAVILRKALVAAVQDARRYELPVEVLVQASESLQVEWPSAEPAGALVLAQPSPAVVAVQWSLAYMAWLAEDGVAAA